MEHFELGKHYHETFAFEGVTLDATFWHDGPPEGIYAAITVHTGRAGLYIPVTPEQLRMIALRFHAAAARIEAYEKQLEAERQVENMTDAELEDAAGAVGFGLVLPASECFNHSQQLYNKDDRIRLAVSGLTGTVDEISGGPAGWSYLIKLDDGGHHCWLQGDEFEALPALEGGN